MGAIGDYRKNKYYKAFKIAEKKNKKEVLKVFKHFWRHQRRVYKMLTDMFNILDYKVFEHYKTNKELAKLYDALLEKVSKYAIKKLKGEELFYYHMKTH